MRGSGMLLRCCSPEVCRCWGTTQYLRIHEHDVAASTHDLAVVFACVGWKRNRQAGVQQRARAHPVSLLLMHVVVCVDTACSACSGTCSG